MRKKVLRVLILLLALCLPVFAAQEQTPPQNDGTKAPDKSVNANEQQPQGDAQKAGDPASKVASEGGGGTATDAASFYKIGLAHYESKQFKDAVDAFKRASRLKPGDADIHYNLGLAYYSSNMYREATKAYEQAVRLRPDWADAHFRLGWMYYILGKKDASFEQHKILQTLSPEQANTLYRIIKVETKNTGPDKKETKTRTKQLAQPDPKEEAKVESRLIISDIGQPAQPTGSTPPVNTEGLPPASQATNDNAASAPNSATQITTEPNTSATPDDKAGAPSNKSTTGDNSAASAPASSTAAASSNIAASSTAAPLKTDPNATTLDEAALVKTYRVGVGDVLDIRLMNTPTTRSTLYTVMEGGLIEYPLAGGPLTVNGMTTEEINARLSAELKRRAVNQGLNEILVTVRDYASHNVVISGLVNSPGMRILHREAVPLYVVLADAQPRTEASRALIMRASGQVAVDLTDPAQMNMLVRPGDVITVSARPPQFYYLGGKIMTPGQKPFQPGITLVQAILAAGGFERAKGDVIEVSREGADGRLTTTKYKLKEIRAGKVPDPRLQPGDRIEVSH
jgi:protein involved in polysaccharide export with SLBB domain/Tfp pilus assembly protein PilF